MSLRRGESRDEDISKCYPTSAAPSARYQRVATYRYPSIYGFAAPFSADPFSTFRSWTGFDLPALAVSRLNRRLFGRDSLYFPGAQRLKRDHDPGGPVAWPLAIGHDCPPTPDPAHSFTYDTATVVPPHHCNCLFCSRSIALVDFRSPCAHGSPAWRSVYHRAFGWYFLVDSEPGKGLTLVENANLGVLSHWRIIYSSSIGTTSIGDNHTGFVPAGGYRFLCLPGGDGFQPGRFQCGFASKLAVGPRWIHTCHDLHPVFLEI